MKPLKYTICICLLLITTNSYAQGLETVLKALDRQETGKLVRGKTEHRISEATYLGTIVSSNGAVKYYVVKEFYKVQAAVVYHGHSRILFFSPKKKLVAEVLVNMPDELPYQLKNNFLYFKYEEKGILKYHKEGVAVLPKMLCVEPGNCYAVDNQPSND